MRFEKVSFETFVSDLSKSGISFTLEDAEKYYNEIQLPKRQTKYSAGYDFAVPVPFYLSGNTTRIVPTGIKCHFDSKEAEAWHLNLYIRSSVGNHGIVLANGTGVIDGDYYNNPDNEGDIMIALHNTLAFGKYFEAGERVMQGIFELHGKIYGDDVTEIRTGGTGSTGR